MTAAPLGEFLNPDVPEPDAVLPETGLKTIPSLCNVVVGEAIAKGEGEKTSLAGVGDEITGYTVEQLALFALPAVRAIPTPAALRVLDKLAVNLFVVKPYRVRASCKISVNGNGFILSSSLSFGTKLIALGVLIVIAGWSGGPTS